MSVVFTVLYRSIKQYWHDCCPVVEINTRAVVEAYIRQKGTLEGKEFYVNIKAILIGIFTMLVGSADERRPF
jgi:hypothetical protein